MIRDASPARAADWETVADLDRAHSPVLRSADRYRGLVAGGGDLLLLVRERAVCGFAALSWALDEATLLNIAVDPRWRRGGDGSQLLAAVLARAAQKGAQRLLLEARASNAAALALYRSAGFRRDATRRDYYPARGDQPRESAVLMSRRLDDLHAHSGNR